MYNIWICLMRLIRVFNFNLLGHIAQPPCQGRTTVRGRQTHGLYTALFNGPWMRKFEQNPAEKCKTSIYRNFIAFLSQLYLFFSKNYRFQVKQWHFRTQMRKIVPFSGQTVTFSHSNAKNRAHRFVPNASHDKCCLMTLSKSKPSGHTMFLLVVRYAITSPIFASSQRSVQSKLSKNWLVGTGQPTCPAQGTAVQAHGRQWNPMGLFSCYIWW